MRSIEAKTMLIPSKDPDEWFGVRYVFNIYRGCEHGCIYCDSRSECYGIDDFANVQVKKNAPELLRNELARKRNKATIGTGSMSDPYGPVERQVGLTRQALEIIAEQGFSVHISTKSDLVCRDKEVLQAINRFGAASVAFTVTTCDDDLAARIEPGAPSPSRRFAAMRELSLAGIHTGVLLMPVLPHITDDPASLEAVAARAAAHGAEFLISWLSVTLRDRQREHFLTQVERLFTGMRGRYESEFGLRYSCDVPDSDSLYRRLGETCARQGLAYGMKAATARVRPQTLQQAPLFQ